MTAKYHLIVLSRRRGWPCPVTWHKRSKPWMDCSTDQLRTTGNQRSTRGPTPSSRPRTFPRKVAAAGNTSSNAVIVGVVWQASGRGVIGVWSQGFMTRW